jgi:hypothetical protein
VVLHGVNPSSTGSGKAVTGRKSDGINLVGFEILINSSIQFGWNNRLFRFAHARRKNLNPVAASPT